MRTTTKIATVATFLIAACSVSPLATPTREVATQAPPVTAQPEIAPSATPEQPSASPTTTSPAATLTPLDLASDLEAIRLRMLHSHENWRSIWVQFHAIEYPPEGPDQLIHLARLQVWVRQPAEVLLLRGPMGDGSPNYLFVSNGARFLEADLLSRPFAGPSILERLFPPEEIPATISGYPIEGMIGYPAGEMIFPAGLAQRQGTYELVGEDSVAGRAALIVDFTPWPTGPIVDRFYIDALTGVLLQHQVLDTTGGGERVESDVVVTRIIYDPEFAPDLFRLEIPDSLCFQEGPEWSVIGDQ